MKSIAILMRPVEVAIDAAARRTDWRRGRATKANASDASLVRHLAFTLPLVIAFAFGLYMPGRAEASNVQFVGNVGYSYVGNTAVLTADEVDNVDSSGFSGTLHLELWAFPSPFNGNFQVGYKLAQYSLGQLTAGFHYSNISTGTIAFAPPPDGTWIFTMVLTEYVAGPTDGGYSPDDFVNFSTPVTFGAPPPPPPPPPPPAPTSALENPQPGSFQSGVGLVSGWSCSPGVSVGVDGGAGLAIPYGSSRGDTAASCGAGNTNTGFGFLLNYNLLGAGAHVAQLYVNGQAQGSPVPFVVTVPSGQFLTGVSKEVAVTDFPSAGRTAVLIWQQAQQNFAIKSVTP
jgi:hypothetical protein